MSNNDANGISVLLVEDQEEVRDALAMLIELLGHRVTAVADGEAAATQIEDSRFDLLLTDLTLPGMSGLDLARLAKQRAPAMRRVIASGYSRSDMHKQGDADDVTFVQKPIDNDWLVELLEEISRNRQ